MHTTLQQEYFPSRGLSIKQKVTGDSFISWCGGQEENRFLWLAAGLAGHGCFLTPFTLLAVIFCGNSMLLWALAIGAIGMVVVTNLAALSMKITIPVLFLSIIIDVGIMVYSIMTALVMTE